MDIKLSAAVVFSALLISCGGGGGGGGGNTLEDNDNRDETSTTLSDTELSQLAQESTVFIRVSGLRYNPDGTNNQNWSGSGFFISDTGYIVTNNHVVTGAGEIKVLVDGISLPYSAEVVGVSECADLAVIKLTSGSGFSALSWYEPRLEPNMEVVATGFPGDVTNLLREPTFTMNRGRVSTAPGGQRMGWAFVEEAVVHSAQIFGGSSGGPLIEVKSGRVAGVNYAGAADDRYLAIANSSAEPLVEQMINGANVKSIGATLELIFMDNGQPAGVYVRAVQAGGKAKKIGIREGDVIVQLASVPLFLTNQETKETAPEKYTMEKYCSILATNNPNNPEDPEDKGKVTQISIMRAGERCVGELNGSPLVCVPNNVGGDGTDTTVNGVLESGDLIVENTGSYSDFYTFTASSSGAVNITMSAESFDSILYVMVQNSENDFEEVGRDFNSNGGDATVEFDVTKDKVYVVAASQIENATGSYTLTFSDNLYKIKELIE